LYLQTPVDGHVERNQHAVAAPPPPAPESIVPTLPLSDAMQIDT
jgi:hypothetical protein